jgi:phage shock protein PspC (stress-responsive transcriptional regulator)
VPSPSPRWRLLRTRPKLISGVCSGIARATGVELWLVRTAFVLAALAGPGFVAYVVLALALPAEDPTRGEYATRAPADTVKWLKVALISGAAIGMFGFFGGIGWDHGGPWPWWNGSGAFGLALLVAGVAIIVVRRREEDASSDQPGAAFAGIPGAPAPAASPAAPTAPPAPTASAMQPDPTATTEFPVFTPPPPAAPSAAPPPAGPRRDPLLVAGRIIAGLGIAALLVAAAGVGGLLWLGALSLPLSGLFLGLGAALLVVLVVLAARTKTLWPAIVAVVVLAGVASATALTSSWTGPVGDRSVIVHDGADLQSPYNMAIGALTLDLSGMQLDGRTVQLEVNHHVGALEVLVPSTADVDVQARVRAGSVSVLGRHFDGLRLDEHVQQAGTGTGGRIQLDVDMSVGDIRVCRDAC